MKTAYLLILSLFLAMTLPAGADDAPTYTYHGEVTGVVCSACSKKVKGALSALPGVKSVKILATDLPGQAKIEIVATSPDLSKAAAIKALGESAEYYQIRKLKKD